MKRRVPKLTLVDDIGKAKTWFSMKAMAITNAFLLTWGLLPAKFQDSLPIGAVVTIAMTFITLGMIGRVVAQAPKEEEKTYKRTIVSYDPAPQSATVVETPESK